MEMHQLRYVVAVARMGTFSRAAEQCHVAQPSLSQQIQKLEDELGERLFDRMKREAKLTSHGEAFLRRAVKILEEVDAAKREATDAQNLLRGTLTIGVLPDHCALSVAGRDGGVHGEVSGRGVGRAGGHDGALAQAGAQLRSGFRPGQPVKRRA